MWYVEPTFDAAHRAVLSNAKPLVYVCPPAGWCVAPLFAQLPPSETPALILVPDGTDLHNLAGVYQRATGQPAHPATGLARTARLLKSRVVRTGVITFPDAAQLIRQSDLDVESIGRCIVAWPEEEPDTEALDTVLAEIRSAHKVVITSNPAAIDDFLKRHAHRAPVVNFAPAPEAPVRDVDYAVTGPSDARTLAAVLDQVDDPKGVTIWHPDGPVGDFPDAVSNPDQPPAEGTVVLADLPTAEVLQSLVAAVRVVAVVRPRQLRHLHATSRLGKALRISGEFDRARHRAGLIRKRLRDLVEQSDYRFAMSAIDPLLDEFDAVQLAAAAVQGLEQPSAPSTEATWTRIHVSAGGKDRVRAGDLMGILLNVAGLKKSDVGRIDVRDNYSLVEVRPDDATRAVGGLTGQSIRGKRIAARPDRK